MHDIMIIGGGPAGLTAALYAARAGKQTVILEKAAFGGQITWSPLVQNYPALPSVSGIVYADNLVGQVLDLGVDTEVEEIVSVTRQEDGWTACSDMGTEYRGRTLIMATGAAPRMLGIEGEQNLVGSGVSFCAVCDGAFYKDRPVAVTGGGDSALQEALFLSELCSRVFLIHRRDAFRGEARLVEALKRRDNVDFVLNSKVTELLGTDELKGVVVRNKDGEEESLVVDGLFVAIGHQPDTKLLNGLAKLDEQGYADMDESCMTGIPGLYVAGDCRRKGVHQLTTAVADGAVAALAACTYLDNLV